MSIADKLKTIAENEQKVYNAGFTEGEKSEYDRSWDATQSKGQPANYEYQFYMWRGEFKPKYDFYFGTNYAANNTFAYANIVDVWKDCYFTTIPKPSQFGTDKLFYECNRLVNARTLHVPETFKWRTNAFQNCSALEEIRIDGIIGGNGFSMAWSPKLSHDSIMSIINALKDLSEDTSGTVWKVTLGSTNIEKLTQNEIAIAENKGWVIA